MKDRCRIGVVGLGVMGRNLTLNMADHGFPVAGFDTDAQKRNTAVGVAHERPILIAGSLAGLVDALTVPRAVLLMVPAGPPVDAVIGQLLPILSRGDCIIDGGNSFYKDTDLRAGATGAVGIHFLGAGISGGERGAREGPSIMPGGPFEAYEIMRPIFEAIAAEAGGEPCVGYLGPGSAGHYVKMVHNGIEYGMLQLIAESYDLMKRGLGLDDDELAGTFAAWNETELGGYLVEITARIFTERDDRTGERLIDVILDEARQKGTGKWTSQDAMDLQVPLPTVDAAVAARHLSMNREERRGIATLIHGQERRFAGERDLFLVNLRNALHAATIVTFAQCMALLAAASKVYAFGLNLGEIARIWRGGCIIRTRVLERIREAFHDEPDLPSLLLHEGLGGEVSRRRQALGWVADTAADLGIPAPAFMASLSYIDGASSPWLPANLIQAQRDYFGAHTYERTDARGAFHTEWQSGNDAGNTTRKGGADRDQHR
jgi:6-phosphogluconate dehydrogenase